MNLKQLKEFIENLPDNKELNFCIGHPFSWRGSYDEVAFRILEDGSYSKKDMLSFIEEAYTEVFYGYKGGEYQYNDYTEIHFEESSSNWTDGEYVENLIQSYDENYVIGPELSLLNLMIKKES